jgi:hypothetical protein
MQSHKENRNTNIFSWWGDQTKVNNELQLHQTLTEQHKAEQSSKQSRYMLRLYLF